MVSIEKSLKLQAYALLLGAGLPPSLRNKVLGQIVKDLELPITLEDIEPKSTESAGATLMPIAVGPSNYPFYCPLCHVAIKDDVSWPITSIEQIAMMEQHLPNCVLVKVLARELRS